MVCLLVPKLPGRLDVHFHMIIVAWRIILRQLLDQIPNFGTIYILIEFYIFISCNHNQLYLLVPWLQGRLDVVSDYRGLKNHNWILSCLNTQINIIVNKWCPKINGIPFWSWYLRVSGCVDVWIESTRIRSVTLHLLFFLSSFLICFFTMAPHHPTIMCLSTRANFTCKLNESMCPH